MSPRLLVLLGLLTVGWAAAASAATHPRVLDDFANVDAWHGSTYPGAALHITSDLGHGKDRAMRLDFALGEGRGYVLASRPLHLRLPKDWVIRFWIRGDAPANTLEFKLVDVNGNVWWRRQRSFHFPQGWTRVAVRKSQVEFAWGPHRGAKLARIRAVEIGVSAGNGGKGSVWIGDLELEAMTPTDLATVRPAASASSGSGAAAAVDGDASSAWHSADSPEAQWLQLDFGHRVALGGLVVDWGRDRPAAFRVATSVGGRQFTDAYRADQTGGARSYVPLPDVECRYLRIRLERSRGNGYEIRELHFEEPGFAETSNKLFEAIARRAPRGDYPRYLRGQQGYWTVLGVDGGTRKALLDEDGRLEVGAGRFTLEPFLRSRGRLSTWADVSRSQGLTDGDLPIPSVTWKRGALRLDTTAFAASTAAGETLYARYRLENASRQPRTAQLFVALRPFQVNPPWQDLNLVGGVAPIGQITRQGRAITVDRAETVLTLTPPSAFGCLPFAGGSLVQELREGRMPPLEKVNDPHRFASGVLRFDLSVPARGSRDVWLAVAASPEAGKALAQEDAEHAASRLEDAIHTWRVRLSRVKIRLPGAAEDLVRTLRANIAYILVNRAGPAFRPGPRDYARSWIRDGALISSALLEMGFQDEVRDFLRWYAGYQQDDGRIPCCIDERGPDPVAEHDSTGEFLFAITDYYQHTGDRAFLQEVWPRVVRAVDYIRFLRDQTRTSAYKGPQSLPAWGLAPASISHEGYSSHPVHSYWDDFFLLRGLKDAVVIAAELGDEKQRASFATLRDEFQADLYTSITQAMARHEIDFIPGSVELGDFDPTSTSIAISPGDELQNLPRAELDRTFDRYLQFFKARQKGTLEWQSYTPYELRNVGTLVRLGHSRMAREALDFFLQGRRPLGWKEWAEVVWRNPRTPAFIGDMPHAWVGAGYIRSLRSLFVYEREHDSSLVLGAGLDPAWLDRAPGVQVADLPTRYGTVGYLARTTRPGHVLFSFEGHLDRPPRQIVLMSPRAAPLVGVRVDDREIDDFEPHSVTLPSLPAKVELLYGR